jgi:prepilin-type N-terminal cleavage/methylation domain-containing protein
MEKYRFLRPLSRGFTLVELMVTIAVLVIVGLIAAPNLQSYLVRSGMSSLRKDFVAAVSRSRSEAVARNTCVAMCQLRSGTTNVCETNEAVDGQWHNGWIMFENAACVSPSGSGFTPTAAQIIVVRQASNPRFTLKDTRGSADRNYLTFNASGVLRGQSATFALKDEEAEDGGPNFRMLSLSTQGQMVVRTQALYDANTAAGN